MEYMYMKNAQDCNWWNIYVTNIQDCNWLGTYMTSTPATGETPPDSFSATGMPSSSSSLITAAACTLPI